jgi:CheY-like chemotaxis protein
VQSIIEAHGGKISLYSEVSKGTSFRIFFPVVARQVATTAAKSVEPVQGGCERILLVDDEPNLVELGKLILEMVGYQVTAQTSSLEALELFHENPDQFDLIISDQTMPKMTGIQLAQKVRQIKKHIPIIVCSGFSESLNEENFKSQEIDAFLMKPVLKTNLFKTIRQVLDRTQQTH